MTSRTEPLGRTPRPTTMLRTLPALAVVLTLGLAGCGSAEKSDDGGSAAGEGSTATPSPSATPSGCSAVTGGSTPQAAIDVDGDGRRDTVVLLPKTACGPTSLQAGDGNDPPRVSLPADEPPVTQIFGVRVPGRDGELVVTRSTHPRGGFQLRVYAAEGARLVELERGSEPLVPFVATDVQEHPLSVGCTENALVVTEAVAHEPAGIAYAWDVRRTAYALDGVTLTAGPTKEIADNVLPAQLTRRWADLVDHTAFAGCRTR